MTITNPISKTRLWFYILFPPACFFVFAYPLIRLGNWYSTGAGFAPTFNLYSSILIWAGSMVAMWYSFSGPNTKVRYLVVHWMGISFIFAVATLCAEGLRLVLSIPHVSPITDVRIVQGVLVFGVLGSLFSILLSHHLAVKRLQIFSPKVSRKYRIVQLSDVHIGSRQGGFMRKIVAKVNALKPNYVVITGDLVDSSAVGFVALESLKQIKAPTFFVIGNHERYADLPKVIDMVDRLGLKTLRQESVVSEELVFLGIDDADRRDQVAQHLPSIDGIGKNINKFSILLYHRPLGWESAIAHGIDLMLSGHTHNGQIFPFNFIVKQQFKRIAGMYQQGPAHLYISSGTGTWGPCMRLGSVNEITVFEIIPEQNQSNL